MHPLCTLSKINKTLRWRTKIEVRVFRARSEKRRKIDANVVRAYERVQGGLRDNPWRRLERPGLPIGAQDGRHGAQDGQLGVQDSPTWRPEPVLSASLERPSVPRGGRNRFSTF